ncbi:hypothetical protein B0H66DRAFT_538394 [Apodospora peruviana]|uniref:Uncharacterized protein n=1 Tax=Apodospora peruviana TaxID=516989 RepID=A0AAE0HT21_9PEZI|nr:hypothetical protein B0H66DRAFT_538394 [Apodospora peruviana]
MSYNTDPDTSSEGSINTPSEGSSDDTVSEQRSHETHPLIREVPLTPEVQDSPQSRRHGAHSSLERPHPVNDGDDFLCGLISLAMIFIILRVLFGGVFNHDGATELPIVANTTDMLHNNETTCRCEDTVVTTYQEEITCSSRGGGAARIYHNRPLAGPATCRCEGANVVRIDQKGTTYRCEGKGRSAQFVFQQEPYTVSAVTAAEPPANAPESPVVINTDTDICPPGIRQHLGDPEKLFANSTDHKSLYAGYRFDRQIGSSQYLDGATTFNDAVTLGPTATLPPAYPWPRRFEFHMRRYLHQVRTFYDHTSLSHGSNGAWTDKLVVELAAGEVINRLRLGQRRNGGYESVTFVEVYTSAGQVKHVGNAPYDDAVIDYYPYGGATGLKGFWGYEGVLVDKLGPIWGL